MTKWGPNVSVCLSLDNPTFSLLGFENKFSARFEFEIGARIELTVTECFECLNPA